MIFILEILVEALVTVGLWWFFKKQYQKNPNFLIVGVVAAVMVGCTVLYNGFCEVPKGNHGVESGWGRVDYDATHRPGWAFIAPWRKMELFSAGLETVHPENSEDHAMHIFSSDRVPLKVTANFSVVATQLHVGRVIDGVGPSMEEVGKELLLPSSEAAISNSGGSIVAHDIWNWSDNGRARKDLEKVVLENFHLELVKQLKILPQFAGLSNEELREVFHIGVQLGSIVPGKEVEDALSANAATEQLRDNQENLKALAVAEEETMAARGKALKRFLSEIGSQVSLSEVASYNLAQTLELSRQKGGLPQQLSWQVGGSPSVVAPVQAGP